MSSSSIYLHFHFWSRNLLILCILEVQNRNTRSVLDCSQFSSDYDVVYHFLFKIMINPINYGWQKSTAYMDTTGTYIQQLNLRDENAVPLSIFCLKNLQQLSILNMPFPSGKPLVRNIFTALNITQILCPTHWEICTGFTIYRLLIQPL